MCESYNIQYDTNYISVMPTNLYGPNDNFDLKKSHVLPALMRKIYLGKCLEGGNWAAIRKDIEKRGIEDLTDDSTNNEIQRVLESYGISMINEIVNVEIWGSGKQEREFLWSEDLIEACVFLMKRSIFEDNIKRQDHFLKYHNKHINMGYGF